MLAERIVAPPATLDNLRAGVDRLRQRLDAIAYPMLEAWGDAGLHAHVQRTQREYRRRCALALRAADEHLQGLARWVRPSKAHKPGA